VKYTLRVSYRKRLAFSLILLALLWGAVELVCWGGLVALRRLKGIEYMPAVVHNLSPRHRAILSAFLTQPGGYMMFSPFLGWTVRPGARGKHGAYRANSEGLRSDREYANVAPPGVVRAEVFGASLVHASDVTNAATWEAILEQADPRLEVMNFAVPGYGPGQAYLRYLQDGRRFRPQIVLIGFSSENIRRTINAFRPFYDGQTGIPLSKPRFILRGGGRLERIDNPIQRLAGYRKLLENPGPELERLGRYDDYFQENRRVSFDALPSVRLAFLFLQRFHEPIRSGPVYNRNSTAFRLTEAILDEFHRTVREDGAVPILVFFPERNDLRGIAKRQPPVYAPLLQDVRRKGYRTIDLRDGFALYGKSRSVPDLMRRHYTRLGNQITARWIGDCLRASRLTSPAGGALRSSDRPAGAPGAGSQLM
jgi:hypothetical protein